MQLFLGCIYLVEKPAPVPSKVEGGAPEKAGEELRVSQSVHATR